MTADIKKMVRDEIKAALGAFGDTLTGRMEQSEEFSRKLKEQVDGLGDEAAADQYRRGGQTGLLAQLHNASSVEEAVSNLRDLANGSTMYGKGASRAHIAGGDTRGLDAVRMMRATAAAKVRDLGPRGALDIAKEWDDDKLAGNLETCLDLNARARGTGPEAKAARRALGTDVVNAGASTIQTEMSAQLLDILHAKTLVRKAGAITLPLTTGQMVQPFLASGVEPTYENENSGPNADQPEDGELLFDRKKLTSIVPVTNELLAESSYAMDAIVRNHMIKQLKKKEDIAFIRGDGLQSSPFGMSYFADLQGNTVECLDKATFDGLSPEAQIREVVRVLTTLVQRVECGDVAMDRPGWAMSCRDKWGFIRLVDGNGNFVFANEMARGTLLGMPFYDTTQIPTNLDYSGTGGDNESELYFADFSTLAIAERGGIDVDVFPNGTYKDSAGNLVSGITNNHTVIRALAYHDFGALYRGKEIARADRCTYGAA